MAQSSVQAREEVADDRGIEMDLHAKVDDGSRRRIAKGPGVATKSVRGFDQSESLVLIFQGDCSIGSRRSSTDNGKVGLDHVLGRVGRRFELIAFWESRTKRTRCAGENAQKEFRQHDTRK